jgi:hypothetical protein
LQLQPPSVPHDENMGHLYAPKMVEQLTVQSAALHVLGQQAPLWHELPAGQVLPHALQLFESVCRLTQAPLHSVWPVAQPQTPLLQVSEQQSPASRHDWPSSLQLRQTLL